jgi:hypothetical protein
MSNAIRNVRPAPLPGVVVSTSISAGGVDAQHAEGIVVSTPISAGGIEANHAEAILAAYSSISQT